MDENESEKLFRQFPPDLSPPEPSTHYWGNCQCWWQFSRVRRGSEERGRPAGVELSDRTSPSGLTLSRRCPLWQLKLLKAVPLLCKNLPQSRQLESLGAWGKNETGDGPRAAALQKTRPDGSHRFTGVKRVILRLYRPGASWKDERPGCFPARSSFFEVTYLWNGFNRMIESVRAAQ